LEGEGCSESCRLEDRDAEPGATALASVQKAFSGFYAVYYHRLNAIATSPGG
jgi:hypothetical protein